MKTNDITQYIQQTNKAFETATLAEKRVMIAEDVIERIKRKNIIISEGRVLHAYKRKNIDYDDSFKETINKGSLECLVCAKGALFCSIIGRINKYTTHDALRDDTHNNFDDPKHKLLLKYFSRKDIDAIETCFEGTSYLNTGRIDEDTCIEFKYRYDTAYMRMIAICNNIITNKGKFIP